MHGFEYSYKKTYENWRHLLLRTNMYLVILIFVIELIMYFVLKESNLILQPTWIYFLDYLIIPTVGNFLIITVGFYLSKHMSPDSEITNYIPSAELALCCSIVASTHSTFSVTLGIFCIPIFTTVIFSSKKLTAHIEILCCFLLTLTLLHRRFSQDSFSSDPYFWAEMLIAYFFLLGTSYVCFVLIRFQQEKSDIIAAGYATQLQLQNQLNKDQKTGLYGANLFTSKLDTMVRQSEATNRSISLAIIDIDDFKKINDTYGHLKGDQVILRLVELMKKNCKRNMFMSRFGGEEFAIIFSGDHTSEFTDFLEQLRIDFEQQQYDFMSDLLTISIGVAVWVHGWTSVDLFENTDTAMYTAKRSGKNQISIYEPSSEI